MNIKYVQELKDVLGFTGIAVVGGIRSGKSHFASIMEKEFGFKRVSFADSLREYLADILAYSDKYDEDVKDVTMLQKFGQFCRTLDEDVWVQHVDAKVFKHKNEGIYPGIVIDDLRQPNEYKWARDNGFIIVRVQASETQRYKRAIEAGDKISKDNFSFETESHYQSFDVDYELYNDGTLEEYSQKVIDLMKEHFNREVKAIKKERESLVVTALKTIKVSRSATKQEGFNEVTEVHIALEELMKEVLDDITFEVMYRLYVEDLTAEHVAEELGISKWKVYQLRMDAIDILHDDVRAIVTGGVEI